MYPIVAMSSQAPLIRAGASKLDSGCIVHCRSTQSASAALTAKNDAGRGGDLPAIAVGHSQFPVALAVIWQVVEKGFAVVGNEGVEIDQRANPVRHPVGDVAHDDTAIGVSDQDDVAQVLPDQEIGDICDMGAEVESRTVAYRRMDRRYS